MLTLSQFRTAVSRYLKRNKIAPATFGRKVLGDPAWVGRLMKGAEPKEATRDIVMKAMERK